MSLPVNSKDSPASGVSGKGLVASIKGAFRGAGNRIRNALDDDNQTAGRVPTDTLPAYHRQAKSNVTIDPNVSYDAPDTVGRDLAFHLTGTNGHTPASSANLVTGPDSRSMTLRERTALVRKYLDELDSLTADSPAGGHPAHSAELFKSKKLVSTLLVLTSVTAPTVAASEEYMKQVRGLVAVHESMVERQMELNEGQMT